VFFHDVATRPKSIVLLSGGLDSAVALKHAAKTSRVGLALTFDYGQRARRREIAAAAAMCRALRIPHKIIRLPWLRTLGRSALTDKSIGLPLGTRLKGLAGPRSAKAVWVPGRNTAFVAIALAHAEALKCERIVAGFNREEGATFPDNSAPFAAAMDRALRKATKGAVRLECPLINFDKARIAAYGRKIGAPLELAWPCYEGGGKLCWRCESCLRFRNALEKSGTLKWYHERCMRRRRARGVTGRASDF
jgi:7-cyano-7-deazaguanine synthase